MVEKCVVLEGFLRHTDQVDAVDDGGVRLGRDELFNVVVCDHFLDDGDTTSRVDVLATECLK
jgi:hypothetical protein